MTQAVQTSVSDAELVGAEGTTISTCRKPFVVGVIFSNEYANLSGRYRSAQIYAYLYDLDKDVQINDKLVVKTPSDELVVVTVVEIGQSSYKAKKYIVDKVDTRAYEVRADNAEKKRQLKQILDIKVKEMDETAKLEAYAERDEGFKALLEQYKAL